MADTVPGYESVTWFGLYGPKGLPAELTARVSGGLTLEYTIGSRSLKKEPTASLMALEQRCLRIIARERNAQAAANGLGNPKRLGVRFK